MRRGGVEERWRGRLGGWRAGEIGGRGCGNSVGGVLVGRWRKWGHGGRVLFCRLLLGIHRGW